MLCQFSFENFRAFRDEALLDFCAENISDHAESVFVDVDKRRFLPLISIYGPNAGGKSTVLDALVYFKLFMTRHASMYGKESDHISSMMANRYTGPQYYLFRDDAETVPMRFDLLFRHKGYEYRYIISILGESIQTEELYYREIGKRNVTCLIDRGVDYCSVDASLPISNLEQVKRVVPLLTYISSTFENEIISNAMDWFFSIATVDYDMPGRDKVFQLPNDDLRVMFLDILKEMDIPIKDFRVVKDDDGNVRDVFTIHEVNGKRYELEYWKESSGTRKVISCLGLIMDCIQSGRMLIADELDAKLHPRLLGYILKLFTDPHINDKGAQLLLTSHDIVNMNPEMFRRDEIWFCTPGYDSASNLYSLVSFRHPDGTLTRKDALFGKQYLEGRYGADPHIQKAGKGWRA